jgi:hypothetical protein
MGVAVSTTCSVTVGGSIVHHASLEEQGAVFFVFLDEPVALADLLGAEVQFFKRFDVGENELLSDMITELDAAVLHVGERHALAF